MDVQATYFQVDYEDLQASEAAAIYVEGFRIHDTFVKDPSNFIAEM